MRRSYGLAPALSGPHQEAPAPLVERMRDDRFWQAALQQAGPIAAGDPHQDPSLLSVTTGSLGPSGHNGAGGAAPQGRWDRRPPHRTRNVGFVPASPSAPHGPGAQPHPPKIPISVRRAQAPGERSGRRLWRPASGERTGQDTAPRQAAQGRPDADVPVGRAERRADARFVRLPTRLDLGASGSSDDGEDPESWLDEASPRATHSPRVNDDEGVTGGFAMGPERPASAQSDATSLLSGLSEDEDEEDGGERMAPWEVSGKANGAGDGEGAAPVSTQAGASEQDETPRERERSDYFRSCREVGARWLKEGAPAGRRKQGAGAPAGSVAIKDGGSRVREAYITACAKRRLVPEPLGMLSSTRRRATMAGGGGGGSGTCNLNSFAIGDARCSALAQRLASEGSLSPMDPERITGLGLADNRLTHVGASALCEALAVNPAITQLDLSRNRIGLEGVDALCTVLRMKTCRIETLALAGNQAGDRGTASICAAVAGSSSVTDLDLSHNSVGPKAAEALADMITTTRSLRRLNCAWNNIRAGAAGKVASALRLNDTIGDLDLGFNAVGSSRDNWATQVLGETLAVNVTLLHLNLSHNGIDDRGARFLAQGLASNKALMAIHFTGNPAVVRLMRCEREQPGADATQAESGIYARFLCFPKVHDHDVWKERQACWICQRWDVHTFRYRSPEDGPAPQSSVRVALSFTGWKETEMELSRHSPRGPLEAHLSLMVPPSRFQYTFRVDGKEMVSKSQPTEPTTRPADDKLTQTLCDKFQLDQADARLLMRQLKAAGFVRIPLMGGPISVASPSEAPQGAGTGNGHVAGHAVDDDVLATWARTMEARDVASVLAVLRSCEEPEVLDEAHGARVEARHAIRPPRLDSHALMRSRVPKVAQWNAQTSLFRHFPRDTRDRLRAAFERDWKLVKLPRSMEARQHKRVRNVLYKYYARLKDIFRYYCSSSSSTDPFSMGLNSFTEMMVHCGVVNEAECRMSDLDTLFVATNYDPHKHKRNPDRALTRHNFLEILARVAFQRYRRDEGAGSVADSLTSLLEDQILPNAHMVKGESFRKKRIVSHKVEAAFLDAMPALELVFKRYSGKHMLPGDAPFMALDEWTALCGDCGILSTDGFTTRDTNVIFVASLETQVDELNSEDSQRMHFYEFLEALARVADALPNLTVMGLAGPRPAQASSRDNVIENRRPQAPGGSGPEERRSEALAKGMSLGEIQWQRLRNIGAQRIVTWSYSKAMLRKAAGIGAGGVPLHVRLPILLEHMKRVLVPGAAGSGQEDARAGVKDKEEKGRRAGGAAASPRRGSVGGAKA